MTRKFLNPSRALTFVGLSQAVKDGPFVFVSGQVALDLSGQLVGPGDPEAQAEQCFSNIESALALAGGSLDDVVKLNCFLADRGAYEGYSRAKLRRFASRAPAGTAVVVAELLDPRFLLEVEATAISAE
jgi:enamine deaminase RidA (YjgF/YER057c/UK114 family)